ncbi:DUF1240 domain-containing protein (plasmid) [Enterobacteriaceae bacterium Kacie_13]|nr:DUF1240 domain-containing protein [Enterobacteriaceae bacterium Kacie_13]
MNNSNKTNETLNSKKNIIARIIAVIIFPLPLPFLVALTLQDILKLLSLGDVIYFNWRSLPILTVMPLYLAYEFVFLSSFFTRNKKVDPSLIKYVDKIGMITCIIFFISVLLGPVINIAFAFSSYHSCPVGGAFSGVYYVKDKSKCFEITGVKPWGKSDSEKRN